MEDPGSEIGMVTSISSPLFHLFMGYSLSYVSATKGATSGSKMDMALSHGTFCLIFTKCTYSYSSIRRTVLSSSFLMGPSWNPQTSVPGPGPPLGPNLPADELLGD